MKLIATRPDGAKLYMTRTDVRTDALGKNYEVEMGFVELNGKKFPEKEIMNIVKFSNDWEEVNG